MNRCPSTIEVTPTTVRKRVDRHFLAIEVEVTRAAAELGLASGLFYAPRVIGYSMVEHVIEFERITGVISLAQILAREPENVDLIQRAGKVLACIHRDLRLSSEFKILLQSHILDLDDELVFLHGDYNTINVGYRPASDDLVIWDWASAPILDTRFTIGPRYFDLAHFLRSLIVHQPIICEASRRFHARADALVTGYKEAGVCDIIPAVLRQAILQVVKLRIRQQVRHWCFLSALSNIKCYMLLSRLTENWHA